ncbi:hypothetical protein [Rhodococcus sp. 14C212]|uniref:hypothetical protein n=1 Tax=Rhodococcus sp. 14C212 TaxID=2711209 RepID=UPI001980A407
MLAYSSTTGSSAQVLPEHGHDDEDEHVIDEVVMQVLASFGFAGLSSATLRRRAGKGSPNETFSERPQVGRVLGFRNYSSL